MKRAGATAAPLRDDERHGALGREVGGSYLSLSLSAVEWGKKAEKSSPRRRQHYPCGVNFLSVTRDVEGCDEVCEASAARLFTPFPRRSRDRSAAAAEKCAAMAVEERAGTAASRPIVLNEIWMIGKRPALIAGAGRSP